MKWLRRQEGDTLVEVAMSLAILATVLVTSFNLANRSFREGMQAREHTQAAFLAQQQAEMLRLYRDELITITPIGTDIMTSGNFNCSTSCHMVVDGSSVKSVAAPVSDGGNFTTAPFNGVPYTVSIKGTPNAITGKGNFTITVTWDSLVTSDKNTSSFDVLLVDKRGIKPQDCSTVCP